MCFNLFNLCLPASNSTRQIASASSVSKKSTRNKKYSQSKLDKKKNSKKYLTYAEENTSAVHSILNVNDSRLIQDRLDYEHEEEGEEAEDVSNKKTVDKSNNSDTPTRAHLHSLKIFKKLSKSNTSFDIAQNLTFRLFHSKSNSNYLSLDLNKKFEDTANTDELEDKNKKKKKSQNFFSLSNILIDSPDKLDSGEKIVPLQDQILKKHSLQHEPTAIQSNFSDAYGYNFAEIDYFSASNTNSGSRNQLGFLSSSASSSTLSSTFTPATGPSKTFELVNHNQAWVKLKIKLD